MPEQGVAPILSAPLLQQTGVRLRRLMNEGFSAYLLSVSLFTAATILVTIYMHDRIALDEAITTEILDTVGTRQEPTDSQKEVGLIGSALAKLNAGAAGQECSDATCIAQRKTLSDVVKDFLGQITPAIDTITNWPSPDAALLSTKTADQPGWPELGETSLCGRNADGTFLMIPAQMRMPSEPGFSPRIARAAYLSDKLAAALNSKAMDRSAARAPSGDLVQAYFISPDSVLRIWTSSDIDVCHEFKRSRLWAAKNYFSQFWEHPDEPYYSTLVYIDYGGNGLVRTTCRSLELPRGYRNAWYSPPYQYGELFGIVCMDFKLASDQVILMRRQLFFETAVVTFPVSQLNDLDQIAVDVTRPPATALPGAVNATPTDSTTVEASVAGSNLPVKPQDHHGPMPSEREIAEDRAIDMQPVTLEVAEVRQAMHAELKDMSSRPLVREITRIPFRGKSAFLLPLGSSGEAFRGLFFFPRSPRLPLPDILFVTLGMALAGAAFTSAAFSWRLQPKNTELRERLSLFRNLQVGIVRVDPQDWIVETNDRAEELFNRKLKKPGVDALPANFRRLVHCRVREIVDEGQEQPVNPRYEFITAKDVSLMRSSGQASAYYARVVQPLAGDMADTAPRSRWIRVLGTPVMLPVGGPGSSHEIGMAEIFATVTDVSPQTVSALDDFVATHPIPQEVA